MIIPQEAQAMGLGGAGFSREKQMAVASLAAQQQATAYMAQQDLSAAAAMGAFPYQPLQGRLNLDKGSQDISRSFVRLLWNKAAEDCVYRLLAYFQLLLDFFFVSCTSCNMYAVLA